MQDLEISDFWLAGLKRLNSVVDSSGEPLVGNLCYDHLQEDYVDSPRIQYSDPNVIDYGRP